MKKDIIALKWITMACHYQLILDNLDAWKSTNQGVQEHQILYMKNFNKLIFGAIEILDESSREFLKARFINKKEATPSFESKSSYYRKRKKALTNLYSLIYPTFELFDKI